MFERPITKRAKRPPPPPDDDDDDDKSLREDDDSRKPDAGGAHNTRSSSSSTSDDHYYFFWRDLDQRMKEHAAAAAKKKEEEDYLELDTFWEHFQDKVPLPKELIPSTTTTTTTTKTSRKAPGTTSSSAATSAQTMVPNLNAATPSSTTTEQEEVTKKKNRLDRLVHTDEFLVDASVAEYTAAIGEIQEIIILQEVNLDEKPKRWWWWRPGQAERKAKSRYQNRLKVRQEEQVMVEMFEKKSQQLKNMTQQIDNITQLEKKSQQVKNIMAWVDSCTRQHVIVSHQLQALAALPTQTKITLAQYTAAAKKEKKKRKRKHERPKGDQVVKLLNPYEPRDELIKTVSDFEEFNGLTLRNVFPEDNSDPTATSAFNLQAVATVYQTLFRKACFLRRENDREGNADQYKTLLKKAVAFLEDAATKIRARRMTQAALNQLVEEIESENNDNDLVKVVEHLQRLRSWLQDKGRNTTTEPALDFPTKYDDIDLAISSMKTVNDKVGVVNEYLNSLMGKLLWLPGPTCQEVHGCQVVFDALLRGISDSLPNTAPVTVEPQCIDSDGLSNATPMNDKALGVARQTPLKGTVRGEIRNAGVLDGRPDRFADFALLKRGGYRKSIYDDTYEVFIEIKPVQRLVSGPNECQNEALNQGLSHAGKALFPALNLGPGFPAHALFVVGTVLHVEVYKLAMVNAGTPDAKLELESSKRLPLVSKDCYQRYMNSDNRHAEDTAVFFGSLFGGKTKGMNAATEPPGIAALAKVMRSSRGALIRLDHPALTVARLLGSGAFGLVLETNKGDVLKLSRYGNTASELSHEGAILKFLKDNLKEEEKEDAARVISLVRHGMFKIPYRGMSVELPGLLLSPKGYRPATINGALLANIAEDLLRGLDWLHRQGISHNDISCTNFVLHDGHAVLIDLACASFLNEVIDTFRGTPDFAHSDIHAGRWMARREYDIAALAYALCTLDNDEETPWPPIAEPCKASRQLKRLEIRQDETTRWLDRVSLDDDVRERLKTSVNFSSEPIRKCSCKTPCCSSGRCQCKVCTEAACGCNGDCDKGQRADPRVARVQPVMFHNPLEL